ncbi:hypothetical protein Tco_1308930, partial [Tanacetum coccineum]
YFNLIKKYLAGRNALSRIEDIEHLIEASQSIPLQRVDSKSLHQHLVVILKLCSTQEYIHSDALKLLQQADDDKTQNPRNALSRIEDIEHLIEASQSISLRRFDSKSPHQHHVVILKLSSTQEYIHSDALKLLQQADDDKTQVTRLGMQ